MAESDTEKLKEQPLGNKDIYKVALDTRNFEISLFWQRSNYFLVLNSALALGFFNLQKQEFAFLLAVFGLFVSFLWYRVNLGSKYWQSRWEHRLYILEKKVAPNLDFFAADWKTIQKDVEESLTNSQSNKGCFRKWLDKQVLNKPSVSYNMILLSLLFFIGWILLIAVRIWKG
ncbi:MAG: hypothetical protein Q8P28_03995 [Deltaproteobacteria bacterium]|nr:hypothetical protein [Deltaproteobacteria bacterium]